MVITVTLLLLSFFTGKGSGAVPGSPSRLRRRDGRESSRSGKGYSPVNGPGFPNARAGARTRDNLIKSQVLFLLSYTSSCRNPFSASGR